MAPNPGANDIISPITHVWEAYWSRKLGSNTPSAFTIPTSSKVVTNAPTATTQDQLLSLCTRTITYVSSIERYSREDKLWNVETLLKLENTCVHVDSSVFHITSFTLLLNNLEYLLTRCKVWFNSYCCWGIYQPRRSKSLFDHESITCPFMLYLQKCWSMWIYWYKGSNTTSTMHMCTRTNCILCSIYFKDLKD